MHGDNFVCTLPLSHYVSKVTGHGSYIAVGTAIAEGWLYTCDVQFGGPHDLPDSHSTIRMKDNFFGDLVNLTHRYRMLESLHWEGREKCGVVSSTICLMLSVLFQQ
jgi:hypothetical protein